MFSSSFFFFADFAGKRWNARMEYLKYNASKKKRKIQQMPAVSLSCCQELSSRRQAPLRIYGVDCDEIAFFRFQYLNCNIASLVK